MSEVMVQFVARNTRILQPIARVQVRQAYSGHTIVLLTTKVAAGSVSQQSTLAEGTPVRLVWGRVPDQASTWYGYAHHLEAAASGELLYALIGTSDVLNSAHTRSWNNVTASYVIRALATDAGFRSFTHVTPAVSEYISQEDDTDWQCMTRLAQDHGYKLWVDGSTLTLTSPREVLLSPWTRSVPTFQGNGGVGDTLQSLEIINGTGAPSGGIAARRVVYGLDKATGQTVQAVSNPAGSSRTLVVSSAKADSYASAWSEATAQSGANDGWVTATANLWGDVRVSPGSLINLTGRSVPAGYDGLWAVESAEHTLQLSGITSYTTKVSLSRNAAYEYQISAVQNLRQSDTSTCVLQNGRWQSTLIEEAVYGV